MKNIIFAFASFFAFSIIFLSCKKDEETVSGVGSLEIEFDNQAGDQSLVFGKNYVTANGDTVNFSTFNYYISNVVLVKTDGSEYVVPKDNSYFLCKHSDEASRLVKIDNIPAGDYSQLRFMIGVDSAKSVSPVEQRTGVLDPASGASGMYWSWNAGYIFVKVEGTSPQAPLAASGEHHFEYHTGLFGGYLNPTLNNLKTVKLVAPDEAAEVRADHEAPQIHLLVDVLEIFTNPTKISIAANPASHADAFSKTVANNYADMFTIDHIHNH